MKDSDFLDFSNAQIRGAEGEPLLMQKQRPHCLPSQRLANDTPALIGSSPTSKTIGIIEVAGLAASVGSAPQTATQRPYRREA
jgi:hypothetical protein